MAYSGTLKVLANASRVKRDPNAVDENGRPIRLLEIWPSGLMAGAVGAGGADALQEAGITNVAKAYGVISAGGPTALARALRKAHLVTDVYLELGEAGFVSALKGRMTRNFEELFGRLRLIFNEGVDGIREDIYAVVTDPEDGKGDMLDIKRAVPDFMSAIFATMAVPNMYPPVMVNGLRWCDGAWADFTDVLAKLVKKTRPTDILMVANLPESPDLVETLEAIGARWLQGSSTKAIDLRSDRMEADELRAVKRMGDLKIIRTLVVRPDRPYAVSKFTTHPRLLKAAAYGMKSQMMQLIETSYKCA
jgi:predicted acylesterase/phospholipase RssA